MIAPDIPDVIWADPPDIFDDMGLWNATQGGNAVSFTRTSTIPRVEDDPRVAALVRAVRAADSYIDKGHYEMARNITRSAHAAFTQSKGETP